jgi:hypothetical protein
MAVLDNTAHKIKDEKQNSCIERIFHAKYIHNANFNQTKSFHM